MRERRRMLILGVTVGIAFGLLVLWRAPAGNFRAQIEAIATGYMAITLDQSVAAHRGDCALAPRAVLLTLDNGYRDCVQHVWPRLQRLGLPAVLFVPIRLPDRRLRLVVSAASTSVHPENLLKSCGCRCAATGRPLFVLSFAQVFQGLGES